MIVRKINPVARGAFTLMEMLVVVAIIVVLAGIGGYYYMGALDNAKIDAAKAQVMVLTTACETYELNNDTRPPNLQALLQPAQNGKAPPLNDPKAIMDPWNKPYQYDASGSRNGGSRPDVWTTPPKGGNPIGNWPGGR